MDTGYREIRSEETKEIRNENDRKRNNKVKK